MNKRQSVSGTTKKSSVGAKMNPQQKQQKDLLKTDRKVVVSQKQPQQQRQQQGRKVNLGNHNPKEPTASTTLDELLVTDPFRWFRDELPKHNQLVRPDKLPMPHHQNAPESAQNPDEKLITIGGYIINMEPNSSSIRTTVQPKICSSNTGLEIEVQISNCPPESIHFEKRYNAILVIGVRNLQNQIGSISSSTMMTSSISELRDPDELLELVNIFVPRDVNLARVIVSEPDSKGRIYIKAP